jgi:hypothetical protein
VRGAIGDRDELAESMSLDSVRTFLWLEESCVGEAVSLSEIVSASNAKSESEWKAYPVVIHLEGLFHELHASVVVLP